MTSERGGRWQERATRAKKRMMGAVDGKNGRREPKPSEGGWEMARTGDEGQKTGDGGSRWQKRAT
jgi:hypothetical protein